jgi:uncharacterized protein YdeI (YjbR/CyaY-like superfamily)
VIRLKFESILKWNNASAIKNNNKILLFFLRNNKILLRFVQKKILLKKTEVLKDQE